MEHICADWSKKVLKRLHIYFDNGILISNSLISRSSISHICEICAYIISKCIWGYIFFLLEFFFDKVVFRKMAEKMNFIPFLIKIYRNTKTYINSIFNHFWSSPLLNLHTLSSVVSIDGNGVFFGGGRSAASSYSLGFSRYLEISSLWTMDLIFEEPKNRMCFDLEKMMSIGTEECCPWPKAATQSMVTVGTFVVWCDYYKRKIISFHLLQ